MKLRPEDDTELMVALPEVPELPPELATHADLDPQQRARRHGRRARPYFPEWEFDEVEAELRAGWLLNGETARWRDVRDAVREGFEEPRK